MKVIRNAFRIFILSQGGSQQISERLVERIGKENVRLGVPVKKIVQKDDGKIRFESSLYLLWNFVFLLKKY